jgi:hypothetical protein
MWSLNRRRARNVRAERKIGRRLAALRYPIYTEFGELRRLGASLRAAPAIDKAKKLPMAEKERRGLG